MREKRKSWDGSQSLPSSITARAKCETPPRQRQTKSGPNLQKDSDFGREISHSSNSIDAISNQSDSKIETNDRGATAQSENKTADSDVSHSHDKSQEASVMENQERSENNAKATANKENVQETSSNNVAQGSNSIQIETHLDNDESSQTKTAGCDKGKVNDEEEIQNRYSENVTKDDFQAKPTKETHDKSCNDSEHEKPESQKKAKDADNVDEKADEQVDVNANQENHEVSAVLTVSESETIQYDTSILRNRDKSPSPEKRKAANLSTIIETQLSSEAAELQLQVIYKLLVVSWLAS